MKELYPAVANSPETVIMGMLAPDTTTVTVQDISKIPDAPNLLVLGAERPDSETVLLTAINGETLHIQRGIDGTTARSWADRTTIARNYTAYDHNAMCEHIDELETLSKVPAGEKPVSFVPADSRSNLSTGEAIKVSFGKLAKWFTDLKAIAWTGSYADISNKPATFPPSAHTHDDIYYTQSEVDSTMSTKANAEAGTWEPILTSGVGAEIKTKHYIKLGSMVIVYFAATIQSITGETLEFEVKGLPFAASLTSLPAQLIIYFYLSNQPDRTQGYIYILGNKVIFRKILNGAASSLRKDDLKSGTGIEFYALYYEG